MYASPSNLAPAARRDVANSLNERLAEGLDLHAQVKVAHWNVKGPLFPALHPLFEQFAVSLAAFNDQIAERAVTLGAVATGTVRQVAAASGLPELPPGVVRGLDLVTLLADRFDAYLAGLRTTRDLADGLGDGDTVDLLTQVVTEFEKNAWFLRATAEGA
ncbi:MAG TPA: DNA starvation/stationary phase protection protein Dps [Anaeromyxobacteraceae bacterium]|nr:DNA starvation/stationary phase protection protein Dps [Anaeromyxobacteraceae bacterium]